MKIKKIDYMDPLVNIKNDCLDVLITLKDDNCYFIEITTPEFFYTLMKKFKSDFVPAGYPYIIVSKLTDEVIRSAIQEFIDAKKDSYWLKLYHVTATLNIEDINEILNRKERKNIELDKKIEEE